MLQGPWSKTVCEYVRSLFPEQISCVPAFPPPISANGRSNMMDSNW